MNHQRFSQLARGMIITAILSGALALLLGLPQPLSGAVLLAMLAGSGILAAGDRRPGLAGRLRRWRLRFAQARQTAAGVADARAARVLAWIACGLMLVSAYFFRPGNAAFWVTPAVWFMLGGGLTMGLALRLGRHSGAMPLPAIPEAAALRPVRANHALVGLGILALALLAEINTNRLNLPVLTGVSYHIQFALLVGGILLIAWGAAGAQRPRFRRWLSANRGELLLVGALALGALVLRGWQVGGLARFEVDETQFMWSVHTLWHTPSVPILQPIVGVFVPYTWFFPYLQTFTIELFGRTFEGLRMVSVIAGAVTVIGVYALARALFDRPAAWIAAALLLTLPAHLHYSRLALLNIVDAMFGTLAFAGMAWGFRTGSRAHYVFGGAALGLTQYFYEGGRLLFPPLVAAWLVLGWLAWKHRPQAKGMLTALLVALVIAAPMYYTLVSGGFSLTQRMDYNYNLFSANDLPVYLKRVAAAFLFLVHNPDALYYYYGGSQPLILWPAVPLFLLGAFYALWRWRRPGTMLLVLWVAAALFGSSLVQVSGLSPRFVVVFPALALVVAVGIRYALPLLWPVTFRWQRVVLAGLTVGLMVGQGMYYFGGHLPEYMQEFWRSRPGPDINDAMLRSAQFPPGTQIHLVSAALTDSYYQNQAATTLQYLADDLTVTIIAPEQFTEAYLESLAWDADHAFFLAPADYRSAALVRSYRDAAGAAYSPYPDIPVIEQFVLYYAAGSAGAGP